jgi:hypothetical protein
MESDKNVTSSSVLQLQGAATRVLQSTPALDQKVRAASPAGVKKPGGRDDRDGIIAEMQRQLEEERDKNRQLEDQFKFRVGSFVKRETQAKKTVESLERQLQDRTDDEHRQRMGVIRNMHDSVISGLECIQNNTAKILQDQEKDLMRAFRARLQDVSKELEAQRNKKGDYSAELQARHRRVVAELHASQELAQIFDKKNQQLHAENQKLQEKLRTREDDRQCLLKELVMAKKEVARLKQQVKEEGKGHSGSGDKSPQHHEESFGGAQKMETKFSQRQLDQARAQSTYNRQYEREVKYRDAIQKLKRMVESERKTVRTLKEGQSGMLQQRTELEVLLRQCLDDVKTEITRKRQEADRNQSNLPRLDQSSAGLSVHELNAQDRERVLELLLSQQRVVQLLYSKAFPQRPPTPPMDTGPNTPTKEKDDLAWLNDLVPE